MGEGQNLYRASSSPCWPVRGLNLLRVWIGFSRSNGTLLYYVFDLLYLDGKDLTGLPLLRRMELLKKVLAENDVIRFSGAVEGEGKRFFELASQRGLEGIVAKR